MDIYHLIIVAAWAAFILYWFVSSFTTKRTLSVSWRWVWWRAIFIIIITILVAQGHFDSGSFTTSGVRNPILETIGALLCVLGIGFAIWARWHLGQNWGMPMSVKENPELVTSGPYAYVRHPIYTGVLLAVFGSALVAGLAWLIPFVGFALYFNYAATKEEVSMLETFPDKYPAYRARTKKLVPFVF